MPQIYYTYGVTTEKNPHYRRSMEDTHILRANVDGVPGQGFFAVFDGHGGKKASAYCKRTAFSFFKNIKSENPDLSIPVVLHRTFSMIDEGLAKNKISSGATAAVAFLEARQENNENIALHSKCW